MAFVPCKGTKLQEEIAGLFTDIAQIVSINLPEAETETGETDTLDNPDSGIPHSATGRTEGGSLGAELFFDPALTGHKKFSDKLKNPKTTLPANYKVIFANAAATEWPFVGAGVSLGGTVELNNFLRATVGIKLSKTVTYPA